MLTFLFCEDMETYAARQNLAEAWRAWEVESCIERNGDHRWRIELEPFYDYDSVDLICDYCPASCIDLGGYDGSEMIYGSIGAMSIDAGNHRSLLPWSGPVSAELVVEHYPANPAHGDEWDAYITIKGQS